MDSEPDYYMDANSPLHTLTPLHPCKEPLLPSEWEAGWGPVLF
jgi:hypothetical protein